MPRKFDIPFSYRSEIISRLKKIRQEQDHYKKDFSPSIIDLDSLRFKLARHFGFCFGVENAIEIAYRAIEECPDQRVFLLSEMIHNPRVNADLSKRGVRFIQKTNGTCLIPLSELKKDDVVIIPAFGATVELLHRLKAIGIETRRYNTTCPFVERVWKRSEQLGKQGYTVILHGHDGHEETRATFSHARLAAPTVIIRDMAEAKIIAEFMQKKRSYHEFYSHFSGRYSPGFSVEKDLQKIGVVNQTTILASETQQISLFLKSIIDTIYSDKESKEHFADTRDTLCYATTENQLATRALVDSGGDFAVVVGGYNSSNTSHLVELLQEAVPVYYIQDSQEILSRLEIRHLDLRSKTQQVKISQNWLKKRSSVSQEIVENKKTPTALQILITAGASCPDRHVDEVISRITELYFNN